MARGRFVLFDVGGHALQLAEKRVEVRVSHLYSVAVLGLSVSLWGGQLGHGFGLGDIQSEQLHVSYYELYYANLRF